MFLSFCSAAAAQGVRPKEEGVSNDEGGGIGWGRSQRGRSVFYPEGNGESPKESGQERSKFRFGLQKSFYRQGPKWRQKDQRGNSDSDWRRRCSMEEIQRMEKGTDPVFETGIWHNIGTG